MTQPRPPGADKYCIAPGENASIGLPAGRLAYRGSLALATRTTL
jgi:hypothetical protein